MTFILILNDMRSSNIEIGQPVAVSDSREELVGWMKEQFHGEVDPATNDREGWRDGTWGKTFKQGSPLEWFNMPGQPVKREGIFCTHDPDGLEFAPDSSDHGIQEMATLQDKLQRLEEDYERMKEEIRIEHQSMISSLHQVGPVAVDI